MLSIGSSFDALVTLTATGVMADDNSTAVTVVLSAGGVTLVALNDEALPWPPELATAIRRAFASAAAGDRHVGICQRRSE